ncbi:GGDEF domain-containing protein [Candidatus Falkowbacteria bacterium]|nr:GGDEF domain-containing protein [Candidatus Falkowbacteria bacterium]
MIADHYRRITELIAALTKGIHEFVKVLLKNLSIDLHVNRLAIFVRADSGNTDEFILRGIHGQIGTDVLDSRHEFRFDLSNRIIRNPTSGIGWDIYVSIHDGDEIVALLALDDTTKARNFTQGQVEMLGSVGLFLDEVFRQRTNIDNFRFTDPLTGILNRRGLEWKMKELQSELLRSPHVPVSVAYIDLDEFGQVNKRHLEAFGDKLLIAFVSELRRLLRSDDIFARVGGDEFVVIWRQPLEIMQKRMNAILEHFSDFTLKEGGFEEQSISFSAGLYQVNTPEEENLVRAVRRANELMRKAKRAGKSRVFAIK